MLKVCNKQDYLNVCLDIYSSSPSLSSPSLATPITPPPLPSAFSLSVRPASRNLAPNALRAPKLAPTSQICSFAFEPAAATVKGSSGEKTVEKTLPYERQKKKGKTFLETNGLRKRDVRLLDLAK